ncbi:MAG: hypothetical protein MJ181_04755 [Treponema sp.]|nr:hypothetical protein [Treponema sp.]
MIIALVNFMGFMLPGTGNIPLKTSLSWDEWMFFMDRNSNLITGMTVFVFLVPAIISIHLLCTFFRKDFLFLPMLLFLFPVFLNWGSPAGAFKFTSEFPFMGCAWWILALSIFLTLVGALYIWILKLLKKHQAK